MKRLTRSQTDRKLAGVLGGIARMLGIDSTIIRVLFILLLFPTGFFPLVATYFLLMFVMPKEEDVLK